MSDEDIQRSLAQLRAEVAALSAARREAAAAPPAPEPVAQPDVPAGAGADTGEKNGERAKEVQHTQLDELLELLESEIKDLPTITCLIVFSLGILMGRFLR